MYYRKNPQTTFIENLQNNIAGKNFIMLYSTVVLSSVENKFSYSKNKAALLENFQGVPNKVTIFVKHCKIFFYFLQNQYIQVYFF